MPDALDAQKRYAVLRLCIDTLEGSGDSSIAQKLRDDQRSLLQEQSTQLAQIAKSRSTAEQANEGRPIESGQGARQMAYWQLLGARPSARSVLDAAATMGSTANLESSLARLQTPWRGQVTQDAVADIGAAIAVSHMVAIVRSMMDLGNELMQHAGVQRSDAESARSNYCRYLIDLANSAVPAPLLDKLATGLLSMPRQCPHCARLRGRTCQSCGKMQPLCICLRSKGECRCQSPRTWLFAYLHMQVTRWPEAVWTVSEGRVLVLQQLVRKQVDEGMRR